MAACPKCSSSTRVLETRGTTRRRECKKCGHRFTTLETLAGADQPQPAPPTTALQPDVRQALPLAGLVLEWESENSTAPGWRRECQVAARTLAEYNPAPAPTWLKRDNRTLNHSNFNCGGE